MSVDAASISAGLQYIEDETSSLHTNGRFDPGSLYYGLAQLNDDVLADTGGLPQEASIDMGTLQGAMRRIRQGIGGPPPPTPQLPVCFSNPAISGSAIVGSVLTCSTGTWSNNPTFSIQWKRNGAHVGNGSFSLPTTGFAADDLITAVVTATNGAGAPTANANTVTLTATPSGTPIANAAALQTALASGTGGATYNLAVGNYGTFYCPNVDYRSNPVTIVGQPGVEFDAISGTMKGLIWQSVKVNASGNGGRGIEIGSGCDTVTLHDVEINTGVSQGSPAGIGIYLRNTANITIQGKAVAATPDITGCSTAVALVGPVNNATITGLTVTNYGVDGIIGGNAGDGNLTNIIVDSNLVSGSTYGVGDHPDAIQFFGVVGLTITNNGCLRGAGQPGQGIFLEGVSNLAVSSNYIFGGIYNAISLAGGSSALINTNFCQGCGDFEERIIVRGAYVNATVTNNKAEAVANYAGDGVNPGFSPTVLPGTNTIIAAASGPTDFTALDAWLVAHPTARRRS